MILSTKLLLSDPEQEVKWRKALLHRKKKPQLFVLYIHPEHSYPLEIMETKHFLKADADDIRHEVIGIADSEAGAVKLFQEAVSQALQKDPQLLDLKSDLREIYL